MWSNGYPQKFPKDPNERHRQYRYQHWQLSLFFTKFRTITKNTLKNAVVLPFPVQFWHSMVLHPIPCDFADLGKKRGFFLFYGGEMGTLFQGYQ